MNKKVKGFTLVELIVVIAIIGILAAVVSLSWMNYISKSRIDTQNTNSRVVFNAAQTITQQQKFAERKLADADKNIGSGDFYFFWDGVKGEVLNADGTPADDQDTVFNKKFADAINKIYTNEAESVYKIYVKDYIVQSVASGRDNGDNCLGTFPNKREEKSSTETVMLFDMNEAMEDAPVPTT